MPRGKPPREQIVLGGVLHLRCSGFCGGEWKPAAEFHRRGRSVGQAHRWKSECKKCQMHRHRLWRAGVRGQVDDEALRNRELDEALRCAPRVTQVRDGQRVGEARAAPVCLIPTTHPAYAGPPRTMIFHPSQAASIARELAEWDAARGISWPDAAD